MATGDDGKRPASPRNDRTRRLEAALRDNLKKRKQLVRTRQDKAAQFEHPAEVSPGSSSEIGDDPDSG